MVASQGWKSHTGERTRASAAVQGDRPTGPAAGHWRGPPVCYYLVWTQTAKS
jgi:hypothetical protein